MNGLGKTVSNTPSVCSTLKCKVSQEEAFCSAKYTRNGGVGGIKLFSVSQGHNLDWNTLWMLLGDVACPPRNPELSPGEGDGWTMRFPERRVEMSAPAQSLGNSLPLHCKAFCGLISQEKGRLTQARLCGSLSEGLVSSPRVASGLHCDRDKGFYWCTHQGCRGGFWSFPLITAH